MPDVHTQCAPTMPEIHISNPGQGTTQCKGGGMWSEGQAFLRYIPFCVWSDVDPLYSAMSVLPVVLTHFKICATPNLRPPIWQYKDLRSFHSF